jgi:hypothetical protein
VLKTLYSVRSCIAHGGTATAKVREAFVQAIKTLGYWTSDWSWQFDAFRVRHIADVARQVTREMLIAFVNRPELLNRDNLLKLELGVLPPWCSPLSLRSK